MSIKYNEKHLQIPSGCPTTSHGRHHSVRKCEFPFYSEILNCTKKQKRFKKFYMPNHSSSIFLALGLDFSDQFRGKFYKQEPQF